MTRLSRLRAETPDFVTTSRLRAPLAAWLVALVSLWVAAASTQSSPFAAGTWAHWDSAHYLHIATHGYSLRRCGPNWCGDAAWFPLYPWTIRALHALGIPATWAGVAISWFFAAVALVLVWTIFLARLPRRTALLGLAYAAFAPGYVYNFAVFPLSLFVAACVAYLGALRARRWNAAAAAGFVAALAYPIGVIVLPVVGLVYVGMVTRRAVATALAAVPPLLAFGVVILDQRAETGSWTAFFDVQKSYKHGFHDPFQTTWDYASIPFRANAPSSWGIAPFWQTLVVTIVLALALAFAVRRRDEMLLVLFAVVAWALPLTQANVSVWRSQDALLPIAPLVARLPRALAVASVVVVAAVAFATAKLFFEGGLV